MLRRLLSGLAMLTVIALTGCAAGNPAATTLNTPLEIKGNVIGGQQAISGARVYVFAASTSGYGSASHSLLNAASTGHSDAMGAYVLTGRYGDFTLAGDYTCTPGQQVYALALGGNPGLVADTDNSAIALMAAGGTCPAAGTFASTIPYVTINEVSTVAAVYALSGFMTSPTAVATSATTLGATGLANAMATVANLHDIANGQAYATTPAVPGYSTASGLSANGTVPQEKINFLANLVAACVNTTGPTSTPCASLFADATSDGTVSGTKPTETITALLNIAHNPGSNVHALYTIPLPTSPFQPALTAEPADWTMEVVYTAPQLSQSFYGSADAQGNIWIPDLDNTVVIKLSPTGVVLSGTSGFPGGLAPLDVAIDSVGNAWVATPPGLVKLSSTGTLLDTVNAGNNQRTSVAFDPTGDAILNSYQSIYKISADTSSVLGPYADGQVLAPAQNAVDTAGTTWLPQVNSNQIVSVSNDGATVTGHTGAGMSHPDGVAIDHAGNIWVGNQNTNGGVSKFNSSGTPIALYTGGGATLNEGVSVDGDGKIFTVGDPGIISIFSPNGVALSPSTGYSGAFSFATGLIIDGSGNVWVPNRLSGTISQFIGLAAPVATPLLPSQLGVRP